MDHHRVGDWLLLAILLFEMSMCSATRLEEWVGSHGQSSNQQPQGECNPVRQKFVELNLGSPHEVPDAKIHDPDMDICYSGKKDMDKRTCCTSETERKYSQQAKQDIHTVMQQTSSYLKKIISTNVAHYQDLFLSMLQQAHNNTETLFREVYSLPIRDSHGPVDSFFMDLEAFLKRGDVHIQDSTDTFFDALFPIVYHNNVNDPSTTDLNEDYRECLMEIRQDLYPQPFGQVPSRLSHQLSKSFSSARAFLEALHVGVEVINLTDHMALDHRCTHALTRLEYCAHCEGYLDMLPCKGFCFNVMRGCLAYIADVDERWNEFIDALQKLASNMRGQYDIEEVLHSLHTRVSDAVLHAMETGIRFNEKVKERCGQPRPLEQVRSTLEEDDAAKSKHHKKNHAQLVSQSKVGTKLYSKVEMFMRNLVASKGFFLHLPDTLCSADRFSAGLEGTCWNGEDLKPYNKTVVAMQLVLQIDNPEVKIPDNTPHIIVNITDKLQHMKKTLQSRASAALKDRLDNQMQGDEAWPSNADRTNNEWGGGYDNWGERSSGNWQNYPGNDKYGQHGKYGYPMDDEDAYYSGSGSGHGPDHSGKPGIHRNGDKKGVNSETDIYYERDEFGNKRSSLETEPPYITQKQPDNDWRPAHAVAPSSGIVLISVTSILVSLTLWLNG